MVWPRDGNMAYHTGIGRRTVGRLLPGRKGVESIRVVCAHDCPDMCSLLAHVES